MTLTVTPLICVKKHLPKEDGFYPTNVGFQYFQGGIWLTPTEYSAWEPTHDRDVTHWVDVKQKITPISLQG